MRGAECNDNCWIHSISEVHSSSVKTVETSLEEESLNKIQIKSVNSSALCWLVDPSRFLFKLVIIIPVSFSQNLPSFGLVNFPIKVYAFKGWGG